MRFGRDRVFWYVLLGLAALYVLIVVVRGGAGSALAFITRFAIFALGLVLAITVHEFSHAWSANLLGDPTARLAGRLTLNPIAHLDPLGSLMIVVTTLTGVGIGWGKPTPVSPWRLKYGARVGNGIVALAGPVSNLAVAIAFGLPLRFASLGFWPFAIVNAVVLTNLYIAMFNLLPIPPLDGHSVLLGLLGLSRGNWAWRISQFLMRLEAQGPLLLIGLLIVAQVLRFPVLSWLVGAPANAVYRLIVG